MLPHDIHTRRAQSAWTLLLLLSPVIYLAGIILVARTDPNAQAGLAVDRDQAIALAAGMAAARGQTVTDWETFCHVEPNNPRYFYYRLRPGQDRDLARGLVPPVIVHVLFRSPDRETNLEISLTPDGQFLGFIRRGALAQETADPGEAAARAEAEAALRSRPALASFPSLPAPTLKEDLTQGTIIRHYSWRLPLASLPEMELQPKVTVRGAVVTEDLVEARIDPAFARQFLEFGGGPTIALKIIFSLTMVFVVILGIYRFVQRARQREVSYQRILVLTCGVTIPFLSVILLTDLATFNFASDVNNQKSVWVVYLSGTISYIFMGLLLGIAYGSGEGDLREAYPGKLTSLDGLIMGRFFSRDVARAIVVGVALGGWALLLRDLVPLFWLSQPAAGLEIEAESLDLLLGRISWLMPLVGWVIDVAIVAVMGLLLPLPFLQRRLRSPRVVLALLSLFALIASIGPGVRFRPWVGLLLIGAVRAASLLFAFFRYDLLTALVALAAPNVATFIVYLLAQPSASLRQSGMIAAGIALAWLALELYFAWRGRALGDDEVRPVYARNLAERLALQAEASAAREAQTRLMPQTLPRLARLAIAGRCLPAHEVGGDFYDVFPLDEERLGIFIAEGGGRGLASALSIAYAKGYLMPRLRNETGRDTSPAEIMRGLQSRLLCVLEEVRGMGVAFAVIDTSDGTLRYARTGDYPRVLIGRGGASGELLSPDEEAVRFAAGDGAPEIVVTEGNFQLAKGDEVILITDGIAKSLAAAGGLSGSGFWRALASDGSRTNDQLERALEKAVDVSLRRARGLGLEDDLTAVVVRLGRAAASPARGEG